MSTIHRIKLLEEICDIVTGEMHGRNTKLTERSFFLEEIAEIEPLERRELLRDYICNSIVNLLIGVQDQARSLVATLKVDASITPFILERTMLEYSYKIAYLADPGVNRKERIQRFLRLYYVEIHEFENVPEMLRSSSDNEFAAKSKRQIMEWHLELTGRKLVRLRPYEIFDAVWKSGLETWQNKTGDANTIYEKGYRIGSALVHGNSWAINHYCLETKLIDNGSVTTPYLSEETMRNLLLIAAGCLMHSFGFVCQLIDYLPVGAMNKLESKIDGIRHS